MKRKLLFICVHNSARSQMAEAWFNKICGSDWEAQSAGLKPGVLNPIVIEAMREVGIDILGKATRAVSDVARSGEVFTYVITVCDDADAEGCPIFPGAAERLHWPFPDPSKFTGTTEPEACADARGARSDPPQDRGMVRRKLQCGQLRLTPHRNSSPRPRCNRSNVPRSESRGPRPGRDRCPTGVGRARRRAIAS